MGDMSSPNNMKTGFVLGGTPENYFPETFFIIYLVLAAILRRCGFKDCVLYSMHSKRVFNQEMFDAGVILNLYSEYGVGKSLKPLLVELFSTIGLDPEKNRFNIFFQEIVRLTPEVITIVRSKDPIVETQWMMKYAMQMEPSKDDIANERILRMADLLYEIPSTEETSDEMQEEFDEMQEEFDEGVDKDSMYISYSEETFDSYESDTSEESSLGEQSLGGQNVGGTTSSGGTSSDPNSSDSSDGIICYCLFCHEFRKYYGPYKGRNVTDMINDTLMNITSEIRQSNLGYH